MITRPRERFFDSVREVFRQRPRDEWVELMQASDVNCQPIEAAELVFDHPQLVHTGGVATIELPDVGPVTQLGHTYELSTRSTGHHGEQLVPDSESRVTLRGFS